MSNEFTSRGFFPVFTSVFNDFERVINESMRTAKTSYPTNIIDLDGKGFRLEVALAGFSKNEIDVEVKDRVLTIRATPAEKQDVVYLRQGISYKNMETTFQLSDKIDISKISVKFVNGLLMVDVPLREDEQTNTRKIKIS
jgi:molecular chaperone IbpA